MGIPKRYNKCERCGRVYKCDTERKTFAWMEHRVKCSLASKDVMKSPITTTVLDNGIKTPPYLIQNGLKICNQLPKVIKKSLENCHVCVIDNYIGDEVAFRIRDEIQSLHDSPHCFHKAGRGYNETLRSDLVCWLQGNEPTTSHIKILKRSINTLVTSIHFEKIPSVTHFTHFQISVFPKGSYGYAVHVDNHNDNGCLLTVVYYCNENYERKKDGGVHRLFLYDKKTVVDIEPKMNRLVIYWSDLRVVHETRACHRELFSLTSWYFNTANGLTV